MNAGVSVRLKKMSDDSNAYVIDIAGENGFAELMRLKEQGTLMTEVLHLLPNDFELQNKEGERVLDLCSGAGEYLRKLAKRYPDTEFIGVDVLESAVWFSNAQVTAQGITNAEFREMDILKPLDIEDESCEFINARFLVGVVPKHYWPTLLAECLRILKPGGVIRLTEPGVVMIENAPFCHKLVPPMMKAFWALDKTFSEYEPALLPALNRLLHAGGYTEIHTQSYDLDCSSGSPFYEKTVTDFIEISDALRPMMLKNGGVPADELDEYITLAAREMRDSEFSALWSITSLVAKKAV